VLQDLVTQWPELHCSNPRHSASLVQGGKQNVPPASPPQSWMWLPARQTSPPEQSPSAVQLCWIMQTPEQGGSSGLAQ